MLTGPNSRIINNNNVLHYGLLIILVIKLGSSDYSQKLCSGTSAIGKIVFSRNISINFKFNRHGLNNNHKFLLATSSIKIIINRKYKIPPG